MTIRIKDPDTYSTTLTLIILVCRAAIAMTGFHWLFAGDALNFGVAVTAFTLTLLPALLILDTVLRAATDTTLTFFLAAHIVLGMQLGLYENSSVYDKAVHILASAALAAMLVLFIQRYCGVRKMELPVGLLTAFVLAGTLSAGTLWELFEFAIDSTGLFYAQRGLNDTMLDLVADAIGAMLTAAVFTITIGINKFTVRSSAKNGHGINHALTN